MKDNDLEEYKKRVGYYSLLPVKDAIGIHLNWSQFIHKTSGLANEWDDIDEGTLEITAGKVSRSWFFTGSDASVASIDVSVLNDAQGARDEVIRLTAQSMALESPFKKLGNGIGDFAVGNLNSEYNKFVWATGNVVLVLYYQPSSRGDGGWELVDRLNTIIKKRVKHDFSSNRPIIDEIKVSSNKVHIGDIVEFEVTVKPHQSDTKVYVTDPEWRLSAEDDYRFKAVTEGTSTVLIKVVDEETMLFSEHKEIIIIEP